MNNQVILNDYKEWFKQKKMKEIFKIVLKDLIKIFEPIKNIKIKIKNKERLKQYNKNYYDKHKTNIIDKNRDWCKEIRTVCCGKDITNHNYSKHLKSKTHKTWLQNKFKCIHNELLERFKK